MAYAPSWPSTTEMEIYRTLQSLYGFRTVGPVQQQRLGATTDDKKPTHDGAPPRGTSQPRGYGHLAGQNMTFESNDTGNDDGVCNGAAAGDSGDAT